jgi:AbiJ N-terminal domain 5
MDKEHGKELIEIKKQIARQFTKSDWLDLGYSLGSYDIIENHSRLLRSLSFGDDDYEGNILEVLTLIVKRDPKNFQELKHFISDKFSSPIISEYISTAHVEPPKRMITFSPQVFEIPTKPQNEKLVTVMLPFKLQSSFIAVKNACDKLGLECKKADDIWENVTFIQDIFELIFTSKVVVADFTGKNPNVFYEVGIAHTLGKTVIPITQSFDDVPSDLGHHRALKYLSNNQGYADLTNDLIKRLETLIPKSTLPWE